MNSSIIGKKLTLRQAEEEEALKLDAFEINKKEIQEKLRQEEEEVFTKKKAEAEVVVENKRVKGILDAQSHQVDALRLSEPRPKLRNILIDDFDHLPPVYNKTSFGAKFFTFKDINTRNNKDRYRSNSWGQPSYPEGNLFDTTFIPVIPKFGVEIEGIDGRYLFYMLSKFVLFDRRYINYNVYKKPPVVAAAVAAAANAWVFHYSLVAYTSSSQVGSWRLCLTEAGNRLNKFDDYVQSTTLHYKICKKMAELYYDPDLLWADELEDNPAPGAEEPHVVRSRNLERNNLNAQDAVPHAMDYDPFVMEGGTHQYFAYPKIYKKTDPNLVMTDIILKRGMPDMFYFWTADKDRGKCGDNVIEGNLLENLKLFSTLLDAYYKPESHTFLYDDRMVYVTYTNKKLFISTAKVFLIRSKIRPVPERKRLPEELDNELKQVFGDLTKAKFHEVIDQICVFYTMKQWALNKDENYASIKKTDIRVGSPDLDVAGSYVQSMPLPYYIVNQLGLYLLYYKVGFGVCKPLEYTTQCRVLEYIRAGGADSTTLIPIEIIENYHFVGYRNSANYPFFCPELYNYADRDINAIYKYRVDQAFILTMPINNDAIMASIAVPVVAAAVPVVPVAGLQRILTVEYPVLLRELNPALRAPPYVNANQTTVSLTGLQNYLTMSIINRISTRVVDAAELAKSISLNKAYTLLQGAVGKISSIVGFYQSDIPIAEAADVPVIPISGGHYRKRKTLKKCNRRKRKTLKKCNRRKRKTQKKHKRGKTQKVRSRS